MRRITELFCFCACLKFATIKQILTFVSMNWSRENQVIHSRHLQQINSCSTNLTGYFLWGTSETCVCRLSGEVWVQGVQTPRLCALFLSIVRDQCSRLEQAWEIPVQQGGSSKGTRGHQPGHGMLTWSPGAPPKTDSRTAWLSADAYPRFLQQHCQDPTGRRGPAHSTWEDTKIITALFSFRDVCLEGNMCQKQL